MDYINEIIKYHGEVKNSLFISGFTIGSFLFAMKSFIVKTMKDEYYDQKSYQKLITDHISNGGKGGYYDSLQSFSTLLFWSITFAFIGGASHITLGYFPHIASAIICLSLSLISWVLVGISLHYVKRNWTLALNAAEKRAHDKASKKRQKKQKK